MAKRANRSRAKNRGDRSGVRPSTSPQPSRRTGGAASSPPRSAHQPKLNKSKEKGSPEQAAGRNPVRRFFANASWQGISGVLAGIAIVEAIGFFFYGQHLQNSEQHLQKVAATANLEVTTTYRYDGSNLWTMNLEVHNDGPATAKDVHLVYSGVHTTCFLTKLVYVNGQWKKVSTVVTKSDLQCNGNALESVVPAKHLAGVNIHPLTSFSADDSIKLFSGTAYSVYPDEVVWVDFHFKAAPDLNHRLKAALPRTSYDARSLTKIVRPFFSQFSQVNVTGVNARVSPTTYSIITLSR